MGKRLKTNYPWTTIGIVVYDEIDQPKDNPEQVDPIAKYKPGSFFPLSLLFGAGHIKVEAQYKDDRPTLMHELQHANDYLYWKNFRRRKKTSQRYYFEMRSEVRELYYIPMKDRKYRTQISIDRLKGLTAKKQSEIFEDMKRTAREFGFDIQTDYNGGELPWA